MSEKKDKAGKLATIKAGTQKVTKLTKRALGAKPDGSISGTKVAGTVAIGVGGVGLTKAIIQGDIVEIILAAFTMLIGGVLKGQEMITNAKLKRMESDNAGLAAAMFSYQDRYLQLPGDDSAAFGRFDVYATDIADGDGNGVVGDGS